MVENDLGPATKVLPCVQNYRGHNTRIIYCDDDRSYPSYWLKRLIHTTKIRPEDCIVVWGFTVDRFGFERKFSRLRPRAKLFISRRGGIKNLPSNIPFWLSRIACQIQNRTLQKPPKLFTGGYVDIAEGLGGVSVSPDFFSQEVFEIPPLLWTHDDVWLSGQLEVNGIGIWVDKYFWNQGRYKIIEIENPGANESEPLYKAVFNGLDRENLNKFCINYFRENYGIWL